MQGCFPQSNTTLRTMRRWDDEGKCKPSGIVPPHPWDCNLARSIGPLDSFSVLPSPLHAATYEQKYYADGNDHIENVELSSAGDTFVFCKWRAMGGHTTMPHIKILGAGIRSSGKMDTTTGWDPTASTYVSDGYKIKTCCLGRKLERQVCVLLVSIPSETESWRHHWCGPQIRSQAVRGRLRSK